MARSGIFSLIAVYCLLLFGPTLSLAASVPASGLTLSSPDPSADLVDSKLNATGRTWYWVSGDGSQIVPITGPQDTPKNLTAAATNGPSYEFTFGNLHGASTSRPGLANFLFDCEFGLFDDTPPSGLGVWTPYPNGQYVCIGNLPGVLRITAVRNHFGWRLAIHDIAFLIKEVHKAQGVQDEVQFFDFVVNYTNDEGARPKQTVAYGEWESSEVVTA